MNRWKYEFQLLGQTALLAPILVMIGFALLAVLLHILNVDPARTLSGGLEMALPLIAGLITATVASQDPAIELQLTMPKRYDRTIMVRLLLIALWSAGVAFLSSLLLSAVKLEFLPQREQTETLWLHILTGQLTWLATLLWCIGMGLCLATLFRSSAASGAIMGCIWLVEILYRGDFVTVLWLRPFFLFPTTLLPLAGPLPPSLFTFWLTNRLEVLGTTLVLLFSGWLLLHNTEGLLKGSGEE